SDRPLVCGLSASITALSKIYHEGLNCRTMTIANNSVKVEQQRNSITSTVRSSALSQRSEQIDFLPTMMMKHRL
ncbi:hypothetical protein, partial [Secundilactobacillus similis]|uniref:hypothetical protein n=1 Tax=Secundilactobacillus similis TaxID=414682 RepID=UPI001F194F89